MMNKNFLELIFVIIVFVLLMICGKKIKSCGTLKSNIHFGLSGNSHRTFLGKGEYNVCGHHLIDPFIYVTDSYQSKADDYAIYLANQPTGLSNSIDSRQRVLNISATSFGNNNLYFFTPEQTDYFLTWLEYYDKLSVIPPHCYSRWMGGLFRRAFYDCKDVVAICRKMLEFTLRYHSDYNDYDSRVRILIMLTVCTEHVNTSLLTPSVRDDFRRLLDEAIAPLPYFFFKPGWQWDPAFLYHKLTGSPRMSLFKSSQVWLGMHDDWSYVDAFTGYSSRGTNKYAAVLISLLYVCGEMVAGRDVYFEPHPKEYVTSSRNVHILDLDVPQYTYRIYEHAVPFSEVERKCYFELFYNILDDWHVSANFRYIPWDFKSIDDIAKVYRGLPGIFKSQYGYSLELLFQKRRELIAEKLNGKLMTRSTLLYGKWKDNLGDRVDVLFNKDSKYKLWVEDGPRWCAPSSLHCICDHPIDGLILIEDAQKIYGIDGGRKAKNVVAFKSIKARGLEPNQEHLIGDTKLYYDESVRESLVKLSLANGMIPSAFVVYSNIVCENGNIDRSITPEFGCWDNAVNRATMIDRSNSATRVFIAAKLNLEDISFHVVWDNVCKVEDQHLTEVGIKRRLNNGQTIKVCTNTINDNCPFPAYQYEYQNAKAELCNQKVSDS